MDRSLWLERAVLAAAAVLTVWGIASFGIWDPWELAPTRVTDAALDLFGMSELSARLPNVIAGLATCALTFLVIRAAASGRAGVVAVAVVASTPLFLLNARLSMGDSIGMAAQAWVGAAALWASSIDRRPAHALLRYALVGAGIAASTWVSGVLLGPLPPVLAVGAWSLISQGRGVGHVGRWLFPLLGLVMVAGVIHAVSLDAPELSRWLGGGAVGGNPPTWDKAFELVFHGFAPWSAALLVAVPWALVPRPSRSDAYQRTAGVLLLWAAFGVVSWTIFASRYGTPPFLAVLPLAGLIGVWLTEAEESGTSRWPAAVVVALMTGLLIRDYALYRDSPLRVLAADVLSVPDVYRPAGQWAIAFLVAGTVLCLMLVSPDGTSRPDSQRTVEWLRARWRDGWPGRGWMLLAISLLGACVVFGLMCFILDMRIASVVVRAGRYAFFAPLGLAALVFGLPWLRYLYSRLGALRVFPVLAAGLGAGAFVALSFQPALSQHFSPKPVYQTFAELTAERSEPLAAYRVPTTAASYYTDAPIEEVDSQAELLRFLGKGGQRWAVLPADQLARVGRAYRRETGEHLYVADARSARLLLVAAEPVVGRPNQSFVAKAVLDGPPAPQHDTQANYDDRIELVGYDLDLPAGDSVGAGQRFTVTWYWRVIAKPPSGYQVFVHIDGNGLRLNGDHEPVEGRYPPRLWETGDVIADTQELTVPANFRSDDYVMYVGWFSGSQRLKVKSGPNDGVDRVRAGVLPVR